MEEKLVHWADQTADRIIRQKGDKSLYTCASGITPSGVVHIGNFRELITVDFVVRALRHRGKNVRFIFSWDDYDVFRKVPKNMPKPEVLETFLRKPIIKTPDTFGCHSSYAEHHEKEMERSIKNANVTPDFIYQSQKYLKSDYAKEIKTALDKRDNIKAILNKYRTSPLDENWFPVSIFCRSCEMDETLVKAYHDEYMLDYECTLCNFKETVDLRNSGCTKLLWRVDWPARWSYEKVDFEPGGKDHSSDGGSYDTAKEIVKEIYNYEPPIYLQYDFVSIKGRGGKISSSSGEVITLDDLLEIYEPEIIRWIFAQYRPNTDFAISFDLDVLKIYEDYDRCERIFYGVEKVSEKRYLSEKRNYEFSQLDKANESMPFQPSFRHLTNVIQIFSGDLNKTEEYYKNDLRDSQSLIKFRTRANCAINWITNFAPQDFKFKINEKCVSVEFEDNFRTGFLRFKELLVKLDELDENTLFNSIYEIINSLSLDSKKFFELCYRKIISLEKGPKLASFLKIIGRERLLPLFEDIK